MESVGGHTFVGTETHINREMAKQKRKSDKRGRPALEAQGAIIVYCS